MPLIPDSPAAIEQYIYQNESVHKLKPENEAELSGPTIP
jgi:hypothetical protein